MLTTDIRVLYISVVLTHIGVRVKTKVNHFYPQCFSLPRVYKKLWVAARKKVDIVNEKAFGTPRRKTKGMFIGPITMGLMYSVLIRFIVKCAIK